ncbi:hypothetical protein CUMW_222560 [Citrus unshiu]|uniref:Uncharacterized protein n=1 Tax=Citrus unshiu TaxID=55188 RepID=A0A2H5QEJ5_CITUN|nr:hypothetical protein CUMW_222560 [Citrus unshiu]
MFDTAISYEYFMQPSGMGLVIDCLNVDCGEVDCQEGSLWSLMNNCVAVQPRIGVAGTGAEICLTKSNLRVYYVKQKTSSTCHLGNKFTAC